MHCPKCRSTVRVKNGKIHKKQRYKCKNYGCNYTQSSLSRTPIEQRMACIRLYLEGMGFRGISRLTGVPHTTIMRWVMTLSGFVQPTSPLNLSM